jgi:hypothetical protein
MEEFVEAAQMLDSLQQKRVSTTSCGTNAENSGQSKKKIVA